MSVAGARRLLYRLVVAVAALAAVDIAEPTWASAHAGGADASNYRSTVTDPGLAGLDWQIWGSDAAIRLTNRTAQVIEVIGYEDEPYLLFIPGNGVYENVRSPAVYLNADRFARVTPPVVADPEAEPTWRKVDTGISYQWHDHRIHWMAASLPPTVSTAEDGPQVVFDWAIPVRSGPGPGGPIASVRGSLIWQAPADAWPPLVTFGLVFGAAVLFAARRTPVGGTWPSLARVPVVLGVLVLAANAVRVVDDMAAATAATTREQVVFGSVAALGLGVIGLLLAAAWRARSRSFVALAAAGMLTMLFFGSGSGSELTASQLMTTLPEPVRRWTVAASFLFVAPACVAAAVAIHHRTRSLGAHLSAFPAPGPDPIEQPS